MVFPLVKLGYLAVKQLSKPLVRVLREKAKTSPFFRTYIVIPPAQIYHKIETVTKMHVLGLGTPNRVEKLNEAMAIDLGADLLGEALIFLIAAGTLTLEYFRSAKSQAAKDDELAYKFKSIGAQIHELGFLVEKQNFKIRELERTLGQYHSEQQNFIVRNLRNLIPLTSDASSKTSENDDKSNTTEIPDDGGGSIVFEPIVDHKLIKQNDDTSEKSSLILDILNEALEPIFNNYK